MATSRSRSHLKYILKTTGSQYHIYFSRGRQPIIIIFTAEVHKSRQISIMLNYLWVFTIFLRWTLTIASHTPTSGLRGTSDFDTASFSLEPTTNFDKPACNLTCRSADTCISFMCSSCGLHCDKTCNVTIKETCASICSEDRCSLKKCKGCEFCATPGDACPLNTFIDVTSELFPKNENYWYKWTHSGRPYTHEGAPLFVDLNNDGRLDYFSSMHGHPLNTFEERMELGESVPTNFTKDGIINQSNSTMQRLRPISERIIIEDPISFRSIDPHGQNIVDLDGDGILDILISSGGDQGSRDKEIHPKNEDSIQDIDVEWKDNFLLWGEQGTDALTGEPVTLFRGGRVAAHMAGVNMRDGRGRVNYLIDVNGDGLLDIFCLQDRRISNELAPGVLLINQGNRTWKEDPTMSEYTRSMMLTDADGDGFAQEIVISRSFCFPARQGPDFDRNYHDLGPFSQNINNFCSTRPVGSIAIYKFSHETNQMNEISTKYSSFGADNNMQSPCCPHGANNGSNDCHVISMASADFDGDLLADHVHLFESKMVLYFSSERTKGQLQGATESTGNEIKLPEHCGAGLSVRIVDLNNDGVEEIIVMCKVVSTILVYTRGESKSDWVLDNGCNDYGSMGALNNATLAGFTEQDYSEVCNDDHKIQWLKLDQICKRRAEGKRPKSPKPAGICLVDLDNDGFLDAVVTHSFGYLRFFKNVPSAKASTNWFITFSVKGDGKSVNLYGIGAVVILNSKLPQGDINQFREVSSYQHTTDKYGCKDDRIIFGLGQYAVPSKVRVRWPNGILQEWSLTEWEFTKEMNPIELALKDLSGVPSLAPTSYPTGESMHALMTGMLS